MRSNLPCGLVSQRHGASFSTSCDGFPPLPTRPGLLGLTGSNDLRAVIEGAGKGELRSQLGLDMFTYRVRKYIGAYTAALDGKVRALALHYWSSLSVMETDDWTAGTAASRGS